RLIISSVIGWSSIRLRVANPTLPDDPPMTTPREAARPLRPYGGARAGRFATVQLHHPVGHDRATAERDLPNALEGGYESVPSLRTFEAPSLSGSFQDDEQPLSAPVTPVDRAPLAPVSAPPATPSFERFGRGQPASAPAAPRSAAEPQGDMRAAPVASNTQAPQGLGIASSSSVQAPSSPGNPTNPRAEPRSTSQTRSTVTKNADGTTTVNGVKSEPAKTVTTPSKEWSADRPLLGGQVSGASRSTQGKVKSADESQASGSKSIVSGPSNPPAEPKSQQPPTPSQGSITPEAAQAVGTAVQSVPAKVQTAAKTVTSAMPAVGQGLKSVAGIVGLGVAGLKNLVSAAAAVPAAKVQPAAATPAPVKKRINKYVAPISATVGYGAGTGSSPAAVRDTSDEDRPFTEAGMTRIGTTPSGAGIYDSGNTINGVKQVFSGDAPSNAFGGMGYGNQSTGHGGGNAGGNGQAGGGGGWGNSGGSDGHGGLSKSSPNASSTAGGTREPGGSK
ncbi:MAG: hypothetical protein ACK503_00995, partial [Labrys sp. (in: a-proteobacteria)]